MKAVTWEQDLANSHSTYWNRHLDTLSVQSKFKNIVVLETQCGVWLTRGVWNRIVSGLSSGQLYFMLRAGADCLPTSLNLWRCSISLTESANSKSVSLNRQCATMLYPALRPQKKGRKVDKYAALVLTWREEAQSVALVTPKIGCLGHHTKGRYHAVPNLQHNDR